MRVTQRAMKIIITYNVFSSKLNLQMFQRFA